MSEYLSYDGYALVFEDDFNGETLDRTKWNIELHDPGWVNEELQAYVDAEDVLSLRDGFVPATINYQVPDEACDLNVVPNRGREAPLRRALSNSLGFGGHNACILLKKWEGEP